MEYRINIRNNWWFDAGIVGLYFIATQQVVKCSEVDINYDRDSLTIYGDPRAL